MLKSVFVLTMFFSLSACATIDKGRNRKPAVDTSAPASIDHPTTFDTLGELGFSPKVIRQILAASPDFVNKLYQYADAKIKSEYVDWKKEWNERYFPPVTPQYVVKVWHFFRGVHMPPREKVDPDYLLFDEHKKPKASVDITTNAAIANGYAWARPGEETPYVMEFEIPVVLTDTGRFDEAYKIGGDDLADLGLNSVTPLLVGIEESKTRPAEALRQ